MERNTRTRVALLGLGVTLAAAVIAARLYQLHVHRAAELSTRAQRQHQTRIEIPGRRGAICDRNGRELAISVESASLYAHPPRFSTDADKLRVATRLSPVLEMPARSILERLRSDRPFVWIKRRLDPGTVLSVERLGLSGWKSALNLKTEPKRFYPRAELAVHVVGYSNIDQVGVEGIEQRFDHALQGDPSTFVAERDGRGGKLLRLVRPDRKQPQDVILTLDLVLQHIVERELERAIQDSGSHTASAVLIEPASGQVLALANRPAADPNRYSDATAAARRNRAVVDLYEPGSTFKTVTAAAALDRGLVDPGQSFFCDQGRTRVAGHTIRDISAFGSLTLQGILEKSSNVGILKVGRMLSSAQFYDTIRKFGFGERTDIELPGENPGIVRPVTRWSALSAASMSFGQEIGVTALQMASAYAAVANDGVRVPPRVVLGTRDPDGTFHPSDPPQARRVISSRTARVLTRMLESVIEHGTGGRARVPGYRIAGKTGTAQKALAKGGYSETDYVASFGGFGPVRAPRLALMVVLDSPRGEAHRGGDVAAPVFARIMADALAHVRAEPDGKPVEQPEPAGPREVWRDLVAVERQPTAPGQVPDVRGLTLRAAVTALASRGYRSQVRGRGVVLDQSPAPGTSLGRGETCSLVLSVGGRQVPGTKARSSP
jgi:cell division protein FtsI (penicillin-binding protein 3)